MKQEYSAKDIFLIMQRVEVSTTPREDDIEILREQTQLKLSDFKIRMIPNSIKYLSNLVSLSFYGTKISSLPDSVGQLSKLRILDVSGTDISVLPESIGNLTELEVLDLNSSYLTVLPESIDHLTNLKKLILRNTSISSLPRSIGTLSNLLELDLSDTRITKLPVSIGELTNLQQLDLRNTALTDLPDTIGQLVSLQTLRISFTRIKSIPETIGNLKKLEWLSLSGTSVRELPESICQLSSLHTLNISNNRLSKLPDSIKSLSSLKTLNLLATNINEIPSWIGDFPNLQHLDLSGLTLASIPESLIKKGLQFVDKRRFGYDDSGINLYAVKLTEQNISVFLDTPSLIPSLYQKNDMTTLRECRVIFLGDGATGKSYTIKRITNNGEKESSIYNYDTRETPGVEIVDYTVGEGKSSFVIHFWDFGGQQLLHSMHRCFLTEETCYVVMVKTRETKANERARYWLRNVTSFAPNSPIVLFVNCWENDDWSRSIDEPGLRAEFPKIEKVVYCSAKEAEKREFCEKVTQTIIGMAEASEGVSKNVPQRWIEVRKHIEEESRYSAYPDGRKIYYLRRERYHELCVEHSITNEQAPELLSFFNNLGVCFSYHLDKDKKELAEYKLLNPAWLTNGIYAIIEEGVSYAREGRIQRSAISQMLCNKAPGKVRGHAYRRTMPDLEYQEYECQYIIDIAKAFDLCYEIDDNTLFFPALCRSNTPESVESIPGIFTHHISYLLQYTYLPDSVLHQLVIRCLRNSMTVENCWLRGVVFSIMGPQKAVVKTIGEEELHIDIYSTEKPYEFFWKLKAEIGEINKKLNIQAEEYIVDGNDKFALEALLNAAKDDAYVYGRNSKRRAQELIGNYYAESAVQSMRVVNGEITIPITRKEFHSWPRTDQILRRALYEAYNGICPYCSNLINSIRDMQVDRILPANAHIRPELQNYLSFLTSSGFDIEKPDYIENFFPAHGHCNRDKSNKINEFSLPYWHEIATQHTPMVLRLMEKYKKTEKLD